MIAILVFVCVLLFLYQIIIYPTFLSPLSKIPNAHPTSSISSLWILFKRYHHQGTEALHEAHQTKGPILRVAPNEISVNVVKGGLQTIYSGGFEKTNWYSALENYGCLNMVSMLESGPHSVRKRMLSHIYSKSYLSTSQSLLAVATSVIHLQLLPRMAGASQRSEPVDIYALFERITLAWNASYIFGAQASTSDVLGQTGCVEFLQLYKERMKHLFWRMEVPGLTRWLERFFIRPVPKKCDEAHRELEKKVLKLCDGAANTYECFPDLTPNVFLQHLDKQHGFPLSHFPLVYAQLRSSLQRQSPKAKEGLSEDRRHEIASELFDLLIAGFDTTSQTLTSLVAELCKPTNIHVQEALIAEVRSLNPPIKFNKFQDPRESMLHPLPSPRDVDALPLLQAIIHETLRLYEAVPGPQPRITPKGGCTIGPYTNIPGGVRINSQAYSLHRNADVFPDPLTWNPQRWLDSNGNFINNGEMHRWFWAFGSGGRGCVGKAFAMYQMVYAVAALFSNFRVRDGGEGEGMVFRKEIGRESEGQVLVLLECID
ncbi:putative cytochrome P450 monooxygenase [Lophiotrema nucula]|uniref:Putative cytochrome P450 monooxygenase n=1 Tax=Lophiotrema nucula TaxID=690887 RepID=A0A6A5ZJX5_9PLEO|nr:putative cytochrome P450 monooxygenase [Lophiotrema nucula]